ncbi:hypothetical protein [Phenylobacterium sp. J367]|uniref:hypothetical protein n=1 Tax=Phenylobacterium sp. J367 TaxID=2898435 RepID=UPI0021507254|nr:hypothetical protein [Phenylobacterium sp. J367]MCR5878810.1 hypothetical protein [Phenylobacterium sp. J367]
MANTNLNVNAEAALSIIAAARAELDRLEALLAPPKGEHIDPKDPRNKDGRNLSARGVEVCYRLFDQGKTIYAVKEAMGISYGAAKYRHETWEKAGGASRTKQPLD